jgi:hypothetical protein
MGESDIRPIDLGSAGGGALITAEDAKELLSGTTGVASSPLEMLAIYNQGKEDYWQSGEDKKKGSVTGIFLFSMRPMRAFWHPDKQMDGTPPTCWSLTSLAPHGMSTKKESDKCGECKWNALGTAKQGKGRACKTKAADFLLEIAEGDVQKSDGNKVYVDPKRIIGPGLLRYSIGNKEGPAEWSGFVKKARELGTVPQGVIARWGWQKAQNKANVKYSAIRIEVLGVLPQPSEDQELWNVILREVRNLKTGSAENILTMLAGSIQTDA